jgi:hypothetical protein
MTITAAMHNSAGLSTILAKVTRFPLVLSLLVPFLPIQGLAQSPAPLLTPSSFVLQPLSDRRLPVGFKTTPQIPVLLPRQMAADAEIFLNPDQASPQRYSVSFDFTPTCNGASVCTLGNFTGEKVNPSSSPPRPATAKPVNIRRSLSGYFFPPNPNTCGAGYCFWTLVWQQGGSRYTLRLKDNNLKAFLLTANSAISNRINNR